MTILVIGGTGQVGSLVVKELAKRNAEVRVLGHRHSGTELPAGVEFVRGDILDIELVRGLFRDVSTVFLLNPDSC